LPSIYPWIAIYPRLSVYPEQQFFPGYQFTLNSNLSLAINLQYSWTAFTPVRRFWTAIISEQLYLAVCQVIPGQKICTLIYMRTELLLTPGQYFTITQQRIPE
jgi:hypothetical protein